MALTGVLILFLILFSNVIDGFRLHHSIKPRVSSSWIKPLFDTDPESDGTAEFKFVGALDAKDDDTVSPESLTVNERMELYFGELKKGTQTEAGPAWLGNANNIGKDLTASASTPRIKQEAWRYNNVKSIFSHPYKTGQPIADLDLSKLKEEISIYIDSSCKESHLVFIDGVYSPSLSNQDGIQSSSAIVSAMSSREMPSSIIDMLGHIPDSTELPRDSFGSDLLTALNLGYLEDAAVIDIPANLKLETPIQVVSLNTASPDCSIASFPRLMVQVGDGAELHLKQTLLTVSRADTTIISSLENEGADKGSELHPTLVNGNTQVTVGREAKVTHLIEQQLARQSRHLEVMSSTVQGDSSYELTVLQMGGTIGRVNVHMDLMQPFANGTLNGVILSGERQSLDIHSSIVHDAENSLSRQQQRNVIGERGEAIFKGRIRIPKHAQMTDSEQLCRSIMTGAEDCGNKGGRLIAMPTLEITADNVVCSHGASVTDLDENSLFYLASRGIDRALARKMLLRGFVFETLISENQKTMDKAACDRVFTKLESLAPLIDTGGADYKDYISV